MLSIVRTLPEDLWRDYVAGHARGSIFHTPEMYQVFTRTRNHRPTLWAAMSGEREICALFSPVMITLKDGLLSRLTTRAVAYDNALYTPEPGGEAALSVLLQHYARNVNGRALFTELRNLSDLSSTQPILNACDFTYQDHLNYIIDLNRPAEEILQSMGRRTRKHIRRGLRKEEVMVEDVTERAKVRVCHDIIKKSYIAAQVPLADVSLFEAAFDVLSPRDMVRFWLARVEDTYVAASVELLYKKVMYGWYGGIDRDYSSYMPGELLMWHILEWGAEHGYREYDFGGAGRPEEEYGVRDFKAKFGGDLVCFGRNIRVHAPHLLRLSELGYRVARPLLHQLNF